MAILRLIIMNVAAYLLLQGAWFLFPEAVQAVVDDLALPSSPAAWIRKPWTLLSYSLIHLDIRHLAVNSLWLACAAALPLSRQCSRSIYAIYAVSALAGGACYLLVNAFAVASQAILVGCSAATFGILGSLPFLPLSRRLPIQGWMLFIPGILLCLLSVFFLQLPQSLPHIAGYLAGIASGKLLLSVTAVSPTTESKLSPSVPRPAVSASVVEKARRSGFNSLDPMERAALINAGGDAGENKLSHH